MTVAPHVAQGHALVQEEEEDPGCFLLLFFFKKNSAYAIEPLNCKLSFRQGHGLDGLPNLKKYTNAIL